jgi:hypothetical protein
LVSGERLGAADTGFETRFHRAETNAVFERNAVSVTVALPAELRRHFHR